MVRMYSFNDRPGNVGFTSLDSSCIFANKNKEKQTMPTLNTVAFDRFIHWITERHNIYLRRLAGQEKPWTEDKVLQRYFFTNPYRENDKVTVWFRENIRDPLADPDYEDPRSLPWATVAFRWFNYIPTGELLNANNLFDGWDNTLACRLLHERERNGKQIFTGAYMIKIENGRSKIDSACDQITKLWDRRANFHESLRHCITLEHGHRIVSRIPFIGPFMAYEIITDLRHTPMFDKATDIMTWCNIGPGAIRGLYRLTHQDDEAPPMRSLSSSPKKNLPVMQQMLERVNLMLLRTQYDQSISGKVVQYKYPQFEMRDLEHSLCEFDKFERARLNQGTMKRKYAGT